MVEVRSHDMEKILNEFVLAHRGLRMGRLFGLPVAYAGRRIFARISDLGLEVKLPASGREAAIRVGAAHRPRRGVERRGWTTLRVTGRSTTATAGTWLELAARHAAETIATPVGREVR